jgi:hypothetical protein
VFKKNISDGVGSPNGSNGTPLDPPLFWLDNIFKYQKKIWTLLDSCPDTCNNLCLSERHILEQGTVGTLQTFFDSCVKKIFIQASISIINQKFAIRIIKSNLA